MKESRQKIIVVIGTTSVGKSKLGIELAKYLKSEVISADSMQVYKGLDILTNKVTEKEMEGIPHHLISIIDPIKDDQFDVNQFNEFCRKKIVEISEKGCIPIIVGGTIYYVESLLWENTIETKEKEVLNEEMVEMYKDFSNEDLHKKLSEIDEEMSKKYHPNQRRKVLRSLQIYHQSNQKQSEIIHNQSSECRYDALIFWLGCETNHLCQRIKGRTNTMIETGGLNELLSLNEQLVSLGYESYYQSKGGLLQSIGFKEFEEYLEYIKTNKSEEDKQKEKMILTDCVEKLNQHTIKYAKKQILWIKNRMVTRDVPIYYLDTSFLDKWDSNVSVVSKEIVDAFVRDSEFPHKNLIVQRVEKSTSDGKVFECEFCNKKIWGEDQINKHLTSKSHKKRKSSVLKKRNIAK